MKPYKKIFQWEMIGIFWIILVGSFLHFTYDLSGNLKLVAIFSPVNESVWEHLKMGYFALVFFVIIEYPILKNQAKNFFTGKLIGIIAMDLFIVIAFYSYKYITGSDSFIFDVASYMTGAVICQFASYNIIKRNSFKSIEKIAPYLFMAVGIMFIYLTFYTPKLPIFQDSNTGEYGIE